MLQLALISTTAAISSQVSLSNQSSAPGTSALISVVFASQKDSISGLQFDSPELTKEPLRCGSGPEQKRRFLIVGFNQNLIADGALINLSST